MSKMEGERTLWYHPESESYIEVWGDVDDDTAMHCVDVTDEERHEEAFEAQQEKNW